LTHVSVSDIHNISGFNSGGNMDSESQAQIENGKTTTWMTPADIILILIITGLSIYQITGGMFDSGHIKTASVYHDGKPIREIPLSSGQHIDLDLTTGNMTLETGDGKIRVIDSSCPRKLCVKQGWVKTNLIPIVCVPNKVILEINSGEDDEEIDAISR